MIVYLNIEFKPKEQLVDRVYFVSVPALLTSSDGSLETKNMKIAFDKSDILDMSIDCSRSFSLDDFKSVENDE